MSDGPHFDELRKEFAAESKRNKEGLLKATEKSQEYWRNQEVLNAARAAKEKIVQNARAEALEQYHKKNPRQPLQQVETPRQELPRQELPHQELPKSVTPANAPKKPWYSQCSERLCGRRPGPNNNNNKQNGGRRTRRAKSRRAKSRRTRRS